MKRKFHATEPSWFSITTIPLLDVGRMLFSFRPDGEAIRRSEGPREYGMSRDPGAAKFGVGLEFARKAVDEKAEPLPRQASAGRDPAAVDRTLADLAKKRSLLENHSRHLVKEGHYWDPGIKRVPFGSRT
jgi:hypothetical protein